MPLVLRQPRVEASHYNLRPLPHRLRRSFSVESSVENSAVNSCLSSPQHIHSIQTSNYPLTPSNYTHSTPHTQYFPIHTPSHASTHTIYTDSTPLSSTPPTPSHSQNTQTTPRTSYSTIFLSLITPWIILIYQLLLTIFKSLKHSITYLLSDILSFNFSTFFQTIFIPSILRLNQQAINNISPIFKEHFLHPLTQTSSLLYTQLRPYYMQVIFVATFHLLQYSLFTIWAYSHLDIQFRNFCLNLRTALTIFILFYYIPINFRTDTQHVAQTLYIFSISYLTSFKFPKHNSTSPHTINSLSTSFASYNHYTMAPRARRTTSLPEAAESSDNASVQLTHEDIIQTIHEQITHNADIVALRHDLNVVHTQLEDIRNALISLTTAQQQTPPQATHTSQPSLRPPPSHTRPITSQPLTHHSSSSLASNPPPQQPTPPPIANYSTSSIPPPSLPSYESILQPSHQPLNIRELFARTSHATLTQAEFESFARLPQDRLTETDTRIFLNRLENYLTQDKTDDELNAEARALRTLSQHIQWRTLAQWLQLYANVEVPFSYPREQFWRKKFDDNATRCYYQPPEKLDLATAIQRLVDTQANRHTNPPRERPTIHLENTRNQITASPNQYASPPPRPMHYRPQFSNNTPFRTNYNTPPFSSTTQQQQHPFIPSHPKSPLSFPPAILKHQ